MALGDRYSVNFFGDRFDGSAEPGVVLDMMTGFNDSPATTYYLQFFDAGATEPPDGTIPKRSILVPAQTNFSYVPAQQGDLYVLGVWWFLSSTPDELTKLTPDPAEVAYVELTGREVRFT